MSEPVRFVLVGAGGIAQSYAQAFDQHPNAKLVAVVDPRLDAAKALAAKFECPAFATWQDALVTGPAADAVIICTPPNTHEEITTAFLRRGVHVWCEKPFALSSESARRMMTEAEKAGRLLTMASKFRYVQDVIAAKRLIAGGTIGDVILFENAFTGRVDMSKRWNSEPAVSGGGVLIDNGTHSVDIMRYFLGPLAEVHAVEGKRTQALAVEDTARLFVRSEAGVMGSVDLSWSLNKELDWYVNVYGTRGCVQVGWKQSRYKNDKSAEWVVFGNGYDKVGAFRDQVANFSAAIRGMQMLRITAQDAIASVEVIEAAYRSMREAPWTGVFPRPVEITRTPLPGTLTSTDRRVVRG